MLVPPPTEPVGTGPAPMPVDMAPPPPSPTRPDPGVPDRRATKVQTVNVKRKLRAVLAERRAKRTRRV
jgi:hypothetical protein